jgi:hypothetical protein
MNKKEIREIKKRLRPDMDNFNHIYGCYVNAAREVVTYIDMPTMLMKQEEKEMYMGFFRKTLSGALGRNLVDIEFPTSHVGVTDEHKLLQALRQKHLSDEDARDLFYRHIIDAVDMDERSYVILIASDSYDVPFKEGSGEEWSEDSTDQFDYIICCLCPVKDSKTALRYFSEEKSFRGASTGSVLQAPELGFMFPAFDDRATNIYNALYYTRSSSEMHDDFIKAVFNVPVVPMAAEAQNNAFDGALSEALDEECSLDVVKAVHSRLREKIELHRESHKPVAPEVEIDELDEILAGSGVSDDGIINFNETCRRYFDGRDSYNPENLINTRAFEIETADSKIKVAPDCAASVKMQVIDGTPYILIPAIDGVTVNGIDVSAPGAGLSAETEDEDAAAADDDDSEVPF